MQTLTELPTTTLYYREGSSDKVYQCQIEQAGERFVVNFAYGRRGGTLNTGTKTNVPVNIDDANVSERSKPASKERMKTSHFEGRIALSAADAAQRRDESTQRELATFDNGFGGAWLVPPAHCA